MATLHLVLGVILPLLLVASSAQLLHNQGNLGHQLRSLFTDNPHDLFNGNCTGIEGKPHSEINASRDAIPGQVVVRVDNYAYPSNLIYCIRMFDRMEDGTGGYPFISEGGAGFYHVSLGYESQQSYALKYYFEIYVEEDSVEKKEEV